MSANNPVPLKQRVFGPQGKFIAELVATLKNNLNFQKITQDTLMLIIGDETTAITTGTAKLTFRMPFGMKITQIRAGLKTASSSGIPTIDIKENGVSIMTTTKLTIDATEKTSLTAAIPAVLTDKVLADDAEITVDITVAGTGAVGLKIWLIGTRV